MTHTPYTRSTISASDANELRDICRAWLAREHNTRAMLARISGVGFYAINDLMADGTVAYRQASKIRSAIRNVPQCEAPEAQMCLRDPEVLAARVAADQAALHGPRLAMLAAEQAKYGLVRRGKLPEEMGA